MHEYLDMCDKNDQHSAEKNFHHMTFLMYLAVLVEQNGNQAQQTKKDVEHNVPYPKIKIREFHSLNQI
jgi:hypothetical protein